MINEGKMLHFAADDSLLKKLPRGKWIGGTTPYFMSEEGGIQTKDRLFADVLDFASEAKISVYGKYNVFQIVEDCYDNGLILIIMPYGSAVATKYAREAPEVEELLARPLGGLSMPYLWLDATYLKCRREGRVASTAVVTAIGCDESGWRHVLGLGVVDTESYDSWLGFLKRIRDRGVGGVMLVTSDAHEGLRRAIQETFQGAAWQRCVVHLIRDCVREAKSRQLRRRVARIVSPVFRAKDAEVVRAMYHLATEMLEDCCPRAARILEDAEPDVLAYLDFPSTHWKRLRTNNVQFRPASLNAHPWRSAA